MRQELTVNATPGSSIRNKRWLQVIVLLVLVVVGFLAYQVFVMRLFTPTLPAAQPISQTVLEEQYGLQVNLIGVTAAGGMLDVRLKVLDAAKAGQLLQGHPLALMAAKNGEILLAPEESQPQELNLEDGGVVYLLVPNAKNLVKPGDAVMILFGDIRLEPIQVK